MRLLLAAGLLLALGSAIARVPAPSQQRLRQLQKGAETLRPNAPDVASVVATLSGNPTLNSVVSVADFGAVGDGTTDNTGAFQNALNAVTNGGIVFVPTGQYSFNGSLTVPLSVSLVGTFMAVPSHNVGEGGNAPTDGSVLMPRGGRGNENGTPFITLSTNAVLRGVVIYYPDVPNTAAPIPYPWSVDMTGNNPAVMDVELLNSYNGIRAVGAARHYIARVQGQPTNTGIYIDQTYDIGRVEDVHWNPWYGQKPVFMQHQLTYGQGFVIARSDWEYVFNCFAFGYAVGYHFIETSSGSCNGNFLGIGADMCPNASVLVDAADPWGIMITNGEFTSFIDTSFGQSSGSHTQVVVSASNSGAVRFVNSAFWGPSNMVANIAGTGTVGFSDCTFNYWDAPSLGLPAIYAASGNLVVSGCDFQHDGNQIVVESAVPKAVIVGNLLKGTKRINNQGCPSYQEGYNAADA